ncbi:WD40 repeat-like protein [Aspergillus novofumigatus IBT 16806]|uniref:WD40 repeat-like protein n=1 Tax=Aspergillus novofumigatus (strain IBT 16806) TaxID=1392255 RepID=A0A2I1C188_ASPN1|nr:WD40 repeat-like protein [Aspergillus novofumigatus IBT 16806]PKX91400.1 WD40 repeat-like protein [Aspergillus novofumigatus IBT 16806]
MEDNKNKLTILGHVVEVQNRVGKIGEAVDLAQDYIKDAIKDVPYAPAVMAGISLILPLLKNPAAIDAANREGLTYVTSQMHYYIEMESLLLPSDLEPGLKADLMKRVLDLYKLIINFQVQSVIRFYRNQTKNYFRSVINYDNWSDQLKLLKEEETRLAEKFERALSATGVQQLKKLAKDRRCRDALQATDPSLNKARIEDDKGGLLRDSYCWVLDHVGFQRWRDRRGSQLLWIKGDPSKGKTIHLNNATAVLRGLIYMLVQQQPAFIRHISDVSFEGENAWFTLLRKSTAYSHVQWVVSSRSWPNIKNGLNGTNQIELNLELNKDTMSAAINSFIQHKLNELADKNKYSPEVRHAVQHHLESKANGTFLWVALACRGLTTVPKRHVLKKLKEFPAGLDKLYKRMWEQMSESDDAQLCRSLLSIMTTSYRPITLDELTSCIDLPKDFPDDQESLSEVIGLCASFLTLRGLKKPDQDPLAATQYACVYWVDHLSECSPSKNTNKDLQESGSIGNFLQQDYLHWLEALSLSKSLSNGVTSILRLERLLKVLEGHSNEVMSATFSHDSKLLASASKDNTIKVWDASNSQCIQTLKGHSDLIYSVIFSHDSKLLASASKDNTIKTVKVWDASNGQCIQTLQGHSGSVYSVTISYSSMFLASASFNKTMRVWDVSNGQCIQTLKGHSSSVYSVTFSDNSKLLASASFDETLWDASNSKCLQTLKDHSGWSYAIFSPDSKLLATVSYDDTTSVWDILKGHTGPINSITFSHDSKLLASASYDETIKVWDISNGRCLQTFNGHSMYVSSVTFSHDSKLLASASYDETIKVWDISNGRCLQTFNGHSMYVSSVTFSHDSKLLASASGDETVKVWDASNSQCRTLKGHSGWVYAVTFSHNSKLLASASDDETIKCLQTLKGHSSSVRSVIFSNDSKLLASGSYDKTIKVWEVSSGQCLKTLKVDRIAYLKSFNMPNSYLETDNGTIYFLNLDAGPTETDPEVVRSQRYGVVDHTWITWNSKNLLWLPPEYRPRTFAVSQSTVRTLLLFITPLDNGS